MAARQDIVIDKEIVQCSICLETFTSPRTLPCLHSFCHECLEEYIKASVKTVNNERGFDCPLCKKFTSAPSQSLSKHKWAAHFPQNFTLRSILDSSNVTGEEQERGEHLCDPCRREDIEVAAVAYCLECEEKMCKNCQQCHRKNKMSSKHVFRNIDEPEEHSKVLNFLQNVTKCSKHPSKKIKYFCDDHNESCCGECTALGIHRRCEHVVSLDEKAKACAKDSTEMADLMNKLEAHTEVLLCDERKQLTALDIAKDETKANLVTIKKKMLETFEELSRKSLEELNIKHEDISVKTVVDISAIEALKDRIKVSREQLDNVKALDNEGHMFLCTTQLEKDLVQVSEDLHTLQKSLKCDSIIVDVKEDMTDMMNWVIIRRVTSELQVLQPPGFQPHRESAHVQQLVGCQPERERSGKQLADYRPCHERSQVPKLAACQRGRKRAQIRQLADCELEWEMFADNRRLVAYQSDTRHARDITGCVWKNENQVFQCDYFACKITAYDVTTSSTEPRSTYKCPSNPESMVKLDETQMAVSYPYINTVHIMDMSQTKPTVVREIKTPSQPSGLAYDSVDKHLLVQSRDGTIRYVRLDGTEVGSLPLTGTNKQAAKYTYNIAFDSRIKVCYLACFDIHKVIAIDRHGQTVFDYSHEKLKYPYGISLGPNDDIYVCSQDGNSIHILDKSRQLLNELLTVDDGTEINDPRIISFNDCKDKFVVVCGDRTDLKVVKTYW